MPTRDFLRWSQEVGDPHAVFDSVWPSTQGDDWCGEHPDFPAYLKARSAEPKAAEQVTS
jgi:hypothetical protein